MTGIHVDIIVAYVRVRLICSNCHVNISPHNFK